MKTLALLLAFVFAFSTVSAQDCTSLSTETGIRVSLWDALAWHNGIDPTSWTVSEFRAEAVAYATFHGLSYDRSATGNLAILHHLNCRDTATTSVSSNVLTVQSVDLSRWAIIETTTDVTGTVVSVDTLRSVPAIQMPVIVDSTISIETVSIETPALCPSVDQSACLICDLGMAASTVQAQWAAYMDLGKTLKQGGISPAVRRHLVDCRIALGRQCRPYHPTVGDYAVANERPSRVKTSNGLAKARAKDFWRSVGMFFRSFGACKRAAH